MIGKKIRFTLEFMIGKSNQFLAYKSYTISHVRYPQMKIITSSLNKGSIVSISAGGFRDYRPTDNKSKFYARIKEFIGTPYDEYISSEYIIFLDDVRDQLIENIIQI